ncbi:MAG: glycerol kinase GlpK [Chloroflexota bacterium]|nr:glycerol kinase GlpK [Chloroflexota bacterium]
MTVASHVLALDQGTTSSRAILFDAAGVPIRVAQRPTTQLYPRPGWVNQDPVEIWETTLGVAREALAAADLPADQIAAIGVATQRETTILWDRATGRAVAPAIVWQSRQSAPFVDAIAARGQTETYQRVTGLVPDAYFSATKIAWLLDADRDLRRRAEAGEILFGTVDAWLLWHLSGGRVHLTDAANASRTMLFDIRAGDWSQPLLDDLAIPRAILPEVRGNAEVLFETAPDLLGAAVPVAAAAGDQQAALFGQTCFAAGQAKNTYGTGSFLLMLTGPEWKASEHRLLTTIAWRINDVTEYALEGAIFVTGAAVQWLRDGLGLIADAADVEPLAASVPDSGGVIFVPALSGLGSPYWDPAARGTLVGLTRGTSAAHIARATLEAIAFQTRDVLDAMTRDAGIPLSELRVDGGAARNDLLLQIQADVLGVPVVRPQTVETTALGAAYLAGLAVGLWPDRAALAERWCIDRRFEPSTAQSDRNARYADWLRAIERSRAWAT